jgi:hypothetical protein
MKPANVMVERRGDCIVTDFGIAKATESPHLTMTGAVVGTPAYMSPEQCLGEEVTAASDQYSLGIMAYELLTGQVPFVGSMLMIQLGHVEKVAQAPHEIVPGIPRDVSDVVMRMIAKDASQRWPTLALAADALIHGLGSTDAQMRREMSILVHELPQDTERSLPATPRTPSLASISQSRSTHALATAGQVDEASTQIVPTAAITRPDQPQSATPAPPAAAAPLTPPPVSPPPASPSAARSRKPVIIGGGVAAVAIAGVMFSLGGSVPEAVPVPVAIDSTEILAAQAAAAATRDSLLDISDTTVVRVGVNPITLAMSVGDSAKLNAFAVGPTGESMRRPMRWSTSDSLAVRVTATGWVHAVTKTPANGPVFITATTANRAGVAVITVK